MNKLMMQYECNGEWFEIWNTNCENLLDAWNEIDEQPTESGIVKFENDILGLVVNGGF